MAKPAAAQTPGPSPCIDTVVEVPLSDRLQFYCLAFFWGVAALLKLAALWMWNSNKYFTTKRRVRPPRCLVDSDLGNHLYIKLKDTKLHYVESGCSDHPPLLLLHGFLDCWLSWRHQIPTLAPHFRVIAVDLRGSGDSEKPTQRKKYRVPILVQELADLITTIGGGTPCVVVGHDLGALLGWFLLYSHPQLVSRFVAISCPHPNVFWQELPPTATFNKRFLQECQVPGVAEARGLQEDLAIIDRHLEHLPAVSCTRGVVSRDTYKYVFSRKVDWTGTLNLYRGTWTSRVRPDVAPARCPVLLLIGDGDRSCSLEAAVRSTELEERLAVRVITGAGHFPHQQAPPAVNKQLLSFLSVPEGRVGCTSSKPLCEQQQQGLVNRMFGALSSTMQYGNHVIGSVTKRSPLEPLSTGLPATLH